MQEALTQPYKNQSFIDKVLLPAVQGRVDDLKIYDSSGEEPLDLTVSEQQYAKSAIKYGEFTTRDETGRSEGSLPHPEGIPLGKGCLWHGKSSTIRSNTER